MAFFVGLCPLAMTNGTFLKGLIMQRSMRFRHPLLIVLLSIIVIGCGGSTNNVPLSTNESLNNISLSYNESLLDTEFTIVVYPDSQSEVDGDSADVPIWQSQNQWVVDKKNTLNIVAIIGAGDIVNFPSDEAYITATSKGYDLIDKAELPYLPLLGNHDYNNVTKRDSSKYDEYFGPSRFKGKTWYLGGYPDHSNANMAIKFHAGLHDYLVVGLEYFPRLESVLWAQSVIDANPDCRIIVATHAYLTRIGKLFLENDLYGPMMDHLQTPQNFDGKMLWDIFIKHNKNIFLVVGGHDICSPNSAHLISTGTHGNTITQIFTNYQCLPRGGDGYISLMIFRPSRGIIEISSYSTTLKANDPNVSPYVVPLPSTDN